MLGETADAVADYGSQRAAAAAGSESAASNGAAGESSTLRRESEGRGRGDHACGHHSKNLLLLAARLKGLKVAGTEK